MKPVHLEFFGLPGCGKSTLSRVLAEKLIAEDFEIREPSFEIDHSNGIKRYLLKAVTGFRFMLRHPLTTAQVVSIVKKNGYSLFSPVFVKLALNIILKLYVYNTGGKGRQIFIWDQGLIQAAVSVVYEKEQSIAAIWNELNKLLYENVSILPVYIKVNRDVAKQRMAGRGTNGARIEKEQDQKRKEKFIDRQLSCFNTICNSFANVCVIENNGKLEAIDYSGLLRCLYTGNVN